MYAPQFFLSGALLYVLSINQILNVQKVSLLNFHNENKEKREKEKVFIKLLKKYLFYRSAKCMLGIRNSRDEGK